MTMISPMRYDVEIHAPLSTPVPMPPSISSSEALVIWMLRIAMNAPIEPAMMAIQVERLALSSADGVRAAGTAATVAFDMPQLLASRARGLPRVRHSPFG